MVAEGLLGFFFFKQKTAYEMRISDWSSDVCSSDLGVAYVRKEHGRINVVVAPGAKRSAEIGVDHTGEIFRRHVAHQIATLPDRQSDRMPVPHAFIHESRAQFGVGNTEQEP